jgi:hypothetical protein
LVEGVHVGQAHQLAHLLGGNVDVDVDFHGARLLTVAFVFDRRGGTGIGMILKRAVDRLATYTAA